MFLQKIELFSVVSQDPRNTQRFLFPLCWRRVTRWATEAGVTTKYEKDLINAQRKHQEDHFHMCVWKRKQPAGLCNKVNCFCNLTICCIC